MLFWNYGKHKGLNTNILYINIKINFKNIKFSISKTRQDLFA